MLYSVSFGTNGVISHYVRGIRRGGTIPQTENDTFTGNNPILIFQGLNSIGK